MSSRRIPDAHEIARRMERAAEHALKEAMYDLQGRAQRLAPIEEGTLRASAESGVRHTAEGLEGFVSFNTPYAAAQHEGEFNHPLGGQRKYLETPFKEHAHRYAEHVAKAVKREIGG